MWSREPFTKQSLVYICCVLPFPFFFFFFFFKIFLNNQCVSFSNLQNARGHPMLRLPLKQKFSMLWWLSTNLSSHYDWKCTRQTIMASAVWLRMEFLLLVLYSYFFFFIHLLSSDFYFHWLENLASLYRWNRKVGNAGCWFALKLQVTSV